MRIIIFLFLIIFSLISLNTTNANATIKLFLNIPSFSLEIFQDDLLIKKYPVAVGKPSTPTPTGIFSIQQKETNPTWIPYPETIVPAGPHNPLGIRWLGFFRTYGLHGTNMPNSIGSAVSNGCIRMNNNDVAEIYELVPLGTSFQIVYQVIQLRQDANGELSIAAFPDIYGWGGLSISNLRKILSRYGFDTAALDNNYMKNILNEHNGNFYPIGITEDIILYTKPISEKAFTINNVSYLPLSPLLQITGLPVKWNEDLTEFDYENITYPTRKVGHNLYIQEKTAISIFSIQIHRHSSDNTIEITNQTDNETPKQAILPKIDFSDRK